MGEGYDVGWWDKRVVLALRGLGGLSVSLLKEMGNAHKYNNTILQYYLK